MRILFQLTSQPVRTSCKLPVSEGIELRHLQITMSQEHTLQLSIFHGPALVKLSKTDCTYSYSDPGHPGSFRLLSNSAMASESWRVISFTTGLAWLIYFQHA